MPAFTKDKVFKVALITLILPLVVVLLILCIPALLALWVLDRIRLFFYGAWLRFRFVRRWKPESKHILFVHSESPNWEHYIEENITPVIRENAVFLNWSKRAEWKNGKPLEAKILYHWGGEFEFNPMAIVFIRGRKVKTIRFLQAFRDYKHGKSLLLRKQETELFACLTPDVKS